LSERAVVAALGEYANLEELLPALRDRTVRLMRSTGEFTLGVARIYSAMLPLVQLINRRQPVTGQELHAVVDGIFEALQAHPVNIQLRSLTSRMRRDNLLPNEQSTENLIRFLLDQVSARSAAVLPPEITEEFWLFFNQLMSEPELKGLGEVSLDALRIFIGAYEPLLVQLVNQLKELRRSNDDRTRDILRSAAVVREDLAIFQRQIRALRYIRHFFDTDPEDLQGQAMIVAQMVREFGPFFIKMAQVAAANSDFLPDEMAEALAVFQEDVAPMTAAEVEQAFLETFGQHPSERYYGFDASQPLKSGSIASVYLAQKPLGDRGRDRSGRDRSGRDRSGRYPQLLMPVVVKVGRHNLEREFLIGKTVIKLAILSSQYWAPHSKLSPFLASWQEQVDVFVEGFRQELDFDAEAHNQARFAERAGYSRGWHVPRVYQHNRRIIEMEFVDDAASLGQAFPRGGGRAALRARRRIGREFLHSMISHLLLYREIHGDLHPGNILVAGRERLYLIDWGNTVDIEALWRPALRYVLAVLSGDAAAVADAVADLAEDRETLSQSSEELAALVEQTLAEAAVTPLGRDFALALYREGQEGMLRRGQLAINLATALSRQGLVLRGDYLHLTRSLSAMLGSYLSLYRGLPPRLMLQDIAQVLVQYPTLESLRQLAGLRKRLGRQLRGGAGLPSVPRRA
jgi:predicted unusual protein kinase regulating ubiquinone biosynthesis (AarF/ABC1/UbiB family)